MKKYSSYITVCVHLSSNAFYVYKRGKLSSELCMYSLKSCGIIYIQPALDLIKSSNIQMLNSVRHYIIKYENHIRVSLFTALMWNIHEINDKIFIDHVFNFIIKGAVICNIFTIPLPAHDFNENSRQPIKTFHKCHICRTQTVYTRIYIDIQTMCDICQKDQPIVDPYITVCGHFACKTCCKLMGVID